MRTVAFALSAALTGLWPPLLFAQGALASAAAPSSPDADMRVDFAPQPPEGRSIREPDRESSDRPPPLRPRAHGLVVESALGLLAFAGDFRHVAPPGYWIRFGLGYEWLSWLLLFGEGELAFTDTSEAVDRSHVRAFPIWGFAGGARTSLPLGERVALIGVADVGALAANVPHGALANLGFARAETLGVQFGGRVGGEWRQGDRHLSISALAGARDATGFARSRASAGAPVMWDISLGLRYAF